MTFSVTGSNLAPTVTLFNGARAASTINTASPYTFSYTLQTGDDGPIVYMAQAVDGASGVASAIFIDNGRAAGTTFTI